MQKQLLELGNNMEDIKPKVTAAFYQCHEVNRYQLKNIMIMPDMYGDSDNDTFVVEYIDKSNKKPKTLEWIVKQKDL